MFQHTERRVELGCEQQRDMEQAFEGLFIKTHGRLCFTVCTCTCVSCIMFVPSYPDSTIQCSLVLGWG